MKYNDITQHEIEALKHDYNLSDAHTHQFQSDTQKKIISKLPELWYSSEKRKQEDVENEFIKNFFRVHGRPSGMSGTKPLLIYASSIAMVVTANYLAKKKLSVNLMHPCFDNITDILKNMNVPLHPLEDVWLQDSKTIYKTLEENVIGDALFIVEPNNPTGTSLFTQGKDAWLELVRYAKDHNKTLLLDLCFTAFLNKEHKYKLFDLYELLDKSGVSYIAYEDTGKTWPLQDTKVAIIKTSRDVFSDVFNIYTAYLLNVSPFVLSLVNEYVLDAERTEFKEVFSLLDINRETGNKTLAGSLLLPIEQKVNIPVMWCKITDPKIRASDLKNHLARDGVHVLPGTYFFWSDPGKGDLFIRIALARNPDMFKESIQALRKSLDKLQSGIIS